MPIDFNKLTESSPAKRYVEPIELFRSLKVSDVAINDLWLAQGDALRQWHDNRQRSDVAIVLNTGAGKTLVGLLAAQSLANEINGRVVYACSSIQLVEQTAKKASGYGLDVTTYFENQYNNGLYHGGQAPCITTYQALFNGKSRFLRPDEFPNIVIFDDAHSAEHLLRDAFTLKININSFSHVYAQITSLFRSYFTRIGNEVGYMETLSSGSIYNALLVPPFVVHANSAALSQILIEAKLTEKPETMFAWEHLKNQIDLCCVFVSGQEVYFTPPVIPTLTLPYFQSKVRRLYLSATLSAKDAFVRTFGREPEPIIAPKTTAGECERLILVPLHNTNCRAEEIDVAKAATIDNKVLVIVPSEQHARKWSDFVGPQANVNVSRQVEAFKENPPPAKLLLKGRYDGVDLPGDTCRVMIIDELPSGVGLLERFLWDKLGLHKVLLSTVASRIVQSFGRISRGMSDHGVVFITGESLYYWLMVPSNKTALPKFLQEQLELGLLISKQPDNKQGFVDGTSQCLSRDPSWLAYYKGEMNKLAAAAESIPDEGALAIAQTEAQFGQAYWERKFEEAAQILDKNLNQTFRVSNNAGAWHALWLGYCYELLGNLDAASQQYNDARNVCKNIPPMDVQLFPNNASGMLPQVIEVARYLLIRSRVERSGFRNFDRDLIGLGGTGTSKQAEEAVLKLGAYLGLDSRRPDKDTGAGPDVLWTSPDLPAFCQELKTDKLSTNQYYKDDVGQMHNHIQWCKDNLDTTEILPTFVGPRVAAVRNANPSPDMMVIELSEYQVIAERLRGALEDICNRATTATLNETISQVFQERDLLWASIYDGMQKRKLVDIE